MLPPKEEPKKVVALEPKCAHNALVPITVGEYEIHLGGAFHINPLLAEEADLLYSLNGDLPNAWFGAKLSVVFAYLQDYGGVPQEWPFFIEQVIEELKDGKKIVAYCTGGHGRTGTFAASLIAALEPETKDPIEAIRQRHCHKAVETLEQATAIFKIAGRALPKKYKKEFAKITKWSKYDAFNFKDTPKWMDEFIEDGYDVSTHSWKEHSKPVDIPFDTDKEK
jgi:hypothetical protein